MPVGKLLFLSLKNATSSLFWPQCFLNLEISMLSGPIYLNKKKYPPAVRSNLLVLQNVEDLYFCRRRSLLKRGIIAENFDLGLTVAAAVVAQHWVVGSTQLFHRNKRIKIFVRIVCIYVLYKFILKLVSPVKSFNGQGEMTPYYEMNSYDIHLHAGCIVQFKISHLIMRVFEIYVGLCLGTRLMYDVYCCIESTDMVG